VRHGITLRFDEFGWESLESEARRDGETVEDLLSRAAAYYDAERLTRRADIDSGRVADRVLDRAEETGGDVP
jgi:hypothetical protein